MTINSRKHLYSDLSFTFDANPNTGDLGLTKDVNAVRQSVINILSTSRGERPFKPELGGNLRAYLFEHFDSVTEYIIKDTIIKSLANYEPRVKVLECLVENYSHRNALHIQLEIEILSPTFATTVVDFTIERIR